MNHLIVLVLFALFGVLAYSVQATSRIMMEPQSFNASLGETANFSCSVERGALYWLINGDPCLCNNIGNVCCEESPRGASARVIQVGPFQNSTLRVNGSIIFNDNIRIQCGVNEDESSPAILRIQGLLSAPQNVSIISVQMERGTFILIVWVAPFTLDLTSQEPDILHYLISIENLATGRWRNVTAMATEYVFQPQDDECCTPLRFCVTAVNNVGEGNRSECVLASLEKALAGEGSTSKCLLSNDTQLNPTIKWNSDQRFNIVLGIAVALGIILMLIFTLCASKVFLSKVVKKSRTRATGGHGNTADVIYAQCGDPTEVRYKEVFYDHPKTPSPQPSLQPCEAYSTLPN